MIIVYFLIGFGYFGVHVSTCKVCQRNFFNVLLFLWEAIGYILGWPLHFVYDMIKIMRPPKPIFESSTDVEAGVDDQNPFGEVPPDIKQRAKNVIVDIPGVGRVVIEKNQDETPDQFFERAKQEVLERVK